MAKNADDIKLPQGATMADTSALPVLQGQTTTSTWQLIEDRLTELKKLYGRMDKARDYAPLESRDV